MPSSRRNPDRENRGPLTLWQWTFPLGLFKVTHGTFCLD